VRKVPYQPTNLLASFSLKEGTNQPTSLVSGRDLSRQLGKAAERCGFSDRQSGAPLIAKGVVP
jgi:hypothetical protein